MIDTKPSWVDSDFYVLSNNSKTYDINVVDLGRNTIRLVKYFCLDDQLTIGQVKNMMKIISQGFENLRLIVDCPYNENSSLIVLNENSQTLQQANIPYKYGKLQVLLIILFYVNFKLLKIFLAFFG